MQDIEGRINRLPIEGPEGDHLDFEWTGESAWARREQSVDEHGYASDECRRTTVTSLAAEGSDHAHAFMTVPDVLVEGVTADEARVLAGPSASRGSGLWDE